MPKIVDYEAKKKMIMEKAVDLFLNKGVHGTHLVDIANSCNIGRTTIYQYFRNKDQILEYTIQHLFNGLREDLKASVIEDEDSALKKIRKIIPAIVQQYHKNRKMLVLVELWLILIRESNPMLKQVNIHMEESRGVFQDLLEQGIDQGEIRQLDSGSMAFTLYATVESFLLHMALHQEQKAGEHIDSLQILLDGLKA